MTHQLIQVGICPHSKPHAQVSHLHSSSLCSKLERSALSGIKPQMVCRCCGLSFCNLLFKANNFDLGAVLLFCLVSELKEPPLPEIDIRPLSPLFRPSHIFSLASENNHLPD
ncbi:hypothetical protein L798_02209 [Zootermopsis nevadensis]|uniref:Uncharacterized protein n=1 Tax=Zootermopsis nevadensis TaxID=136037 RepID=A0A067QHY2_ZOONE|nr:hypothetical protein L798_02209 [Zootermopsis nevadensis]